MKTIALHTLPDFPVLAGYMNISAKEK